LLCAQGQTPVWGFAAGNALLPASFIRRIKGHADIDETLSLIS
jgi:hypothetical protein